MRLDLNTTIKWINHNRYTVILPIIGLVIWIAAYGCSATTESPTGTGEAVTSSQLEHQFIIWKAEQEVMLLKFQLGVEDIAEQEEKWNKVQALLVKVASGSVANMPGLLQIVLASGLIGVVGDNVRKRGLIAGLKRNGPAP